MQERLAHRRLLVTVVGMAIAVAACASGGTASTAPPSPSGSTAGGGDTAYEIDVANDAAVGAFLVGEDGRTLYLFTKDTGGKSVCNGDCATNWPPFTLESGESASAGAGVTGTIGSVARDDGSTQVTYDGAPLYYFAGDKQAGDVNGQGVNDVWFVVPPSGPSASAAASPVASPAASSQAAGATASAAIADFSFSPAQLTVKVGTTVTWTNGGSRSHTVTADDGSFDSGTLAGGIAYSRTFAAAGTYTYHCAIHPGMIGSVVVTP